MRHAKHAAVVLCLLVAVGLAREIVPRDEPGARVASLPAKPASPARVAPSLVSARAAPLQRDSHALAAKSDTGATASARFPASEGVLDLRQPAPPPVQPREPDSGAPGASFRILLEPLAAAPGAVTASFAGRDTGAPRVLELWRVGAGRSQRLGRAVSDSDARIHAPQLALPEAGIALVVTPIGVKPGEPGASQPLQLTRAPDPEDLRPRGSPRWRLPAFAGPPEREFK